MTAHLMVRSTLIDPSARDAFDRWYGEDHLPQATAAFSPVRCWRSWSELDPAIHYAFYEFSNKSKISEMMSSSTFTDLVDDFSRTWDGKVTRERDIMINTQSLENS